MNDSIDVILWDLGGVVVDVDHARGSAHWARVTAGKGPSFETCFFESQVKSRIDDGRQDDTSGLVEVARLSGHISPTEARAAFNAILSVRPNVSALINTLASQVRCAVISNTDPIHAAWIEANCGIEDAIETWVYSFEERAMKPEPELFQAALDRVGVPASSALILDDRADNIATAKAMGLHTHHFKSFEGATRALRDHGFDVP